MNATDRESLLLVRSTELREVAQALMNATEYYDPNVKLAIRAADALRGAADELDRLSSQTHVPCSRCGRLACACTGGPS
jgi:hypothetical protein